MCKNFIGGTPIAQEKTGQGIPIQGQGKRVEFPRKLMWR